VYPPAIAYLLSAIHYLTPAAIGAYHTLIIKSPAIIADLAIGYATFVFVKSRNSYKIALLALTMSLLNLVTSSIWGQYDSLVVLFVVLAVVFATEKRLSIGWAFAALALVTKQTAILFLPAFFIMSTRQKRWKDLFYGFVTFTGIILVFWMPFFFSGYSLDFALGNMGLNPTQIGLNQVSPSGGGGTSIWSFNIWPLITLGEPNLQNLQMGIVGSVKDWLPTQFFGMTYFQLSMISFALLYLLISAKIWKESDPQKIMLHFALLLITFYMIPVRSHNRYLIFGLSFLPFAFKKQKTILVSYLLLLTTYSLSLIYCLLGGPWRSSDPLSDVIFSDYGLLVLIMTNIVVFIWLFYYDFKENRVLHKIGLLCRKAMHKSDSAAVDEEIE
jgi:hypothetical protein